MTKVKIASFKPFQVQTPSPSDLLVGEVVIELPRPLAYQSSFVPASVHAVIGGEWSLDIHLNLGDETMTVGELLDLIGGNLIALELLWKDVELKMDSQMDARLERYRNGGE